MLARRCPVQPADIPTKSIELSQRCHRLSTEAGNLKGMADALRQLIDGYRLTRQVDPLPYLLEAITIAEKLGDPFGIGYNKAMLAEHYLYAGKISESIPLFEDAIETSLPDQP